MSYNIAYDSDSRLIISGLDCACPLDHTDPDKDIYV